MFGRQTTDEYCDCSEWTRLLRHPQVLGSASHGVYADRLHPGFDDVALLNHVRSLRLRVIHLARIKVATSDCWLTLSQFFRGCSLMVAKDWLFSQLSKIDSTPDDVKR